MALGRDRGRKIIPRQTSSFLCKPWRWYADLAVGWHLKVVNCANLCFRLQRSWIVRVFHHELTPPPRSLLSTAADSGGRFVGFFADRLIVAHHFSRWFMNIYVHKLFGKWKLIFSSMGDDSAICFHWGEKKIILVQNENASFYFFPYIPECPCIKLGMFFLIGEYFFALLWSLSTHSRTKQFRNVSFIAFVWDNFTITIVGMHLQRKQFFSLKAVW